MRILGINAVFHDPAAALVVDGEVVAAAEEERFNRRKHGKDNVAFSAWEVPHLAAAWCLREAGLTAADVDVVGYSYDPSLSPTGEAFGAGGVDAARGPATAVGKDLSVDSWDPLRTLYAQRAPLFLTSALPGLDPAKVRFVPHHVAHAASAYLAAPYRDCAVLTADGRGERVSHLAGDVRGGDLTVLASQELPSSLGLLYEDLTGHLGFRRSSDEYKVMAMASYGTPAFLDAFRQLVRTSGDGGFVVEKVDWAEFAPALAKGGDDWTPTHADLASTVQTRLEEVLIELATWLHDQTGHTRLTMAGGVALNCVANSRILRETPFEDLWVQPASGDSGTALGAALYLAHEAGEDVQPMRGADLGRGWSDDELDAWLTQAQVPFERPDDIAEAVADLIADDGVVAWFQGRSEFGPRALGHRSLLADPRNPDNLRRLNDVKGREQFRPVAPMVLLDRAADIFTEGPIPSPYMLFTHGVRDEWRDRIPTVVHVDGTARIQTVDPADEPLVARMLAAVERRTGVPVVVNTSLNTAGRPMVDDPRDALECFGSAPIAALAIGPFLVRRGALFGRSS